MKHDIINLDSKKVGTVELNKDIFSLPIRKDILKDVVNWQLSNRRQGSHKVKQRSEDVEKELLDRIMSRDYGEYSAAQNLDYSETNNGNGFTASENETSIYLQALGEDLPPNLMSEYSTNKGDVDGRG